ncbi:MAG: response regulator transcription factor [Thermodesulfobacteriota bacterium]|nr:response regulator transcription factor [Thermodesulfobacteriota bacterium]
MSPAPSNAAPPPRKTRIIIVDDHMVVVEGIRNALARHPEFQVVDTAADGMEAFKKVRAVNPDIVIMDISMPNLNGVDATHHIKKTKKNVAVVIFSMYSDKEYVLSLFREGISAYVLKEDSLEDLIMALHTVSAGGTYFSRTIKDHVQQHMEELELGEPAMKRGIAILSVREKEVFPLIADGKTIKEISKILNISPKTVESHKYNIMEKLEVHSVAELTKLALKKKLIHL